MVTRDVEHAVLRSRRDDAAVALRAPGRGLAVRVVRHVYDLEARVRLRIEAARHHEGERPRVWIQLRRRHRSRRDHRDHP